MEAVVKGLLVVIVSALLLSLNASEALVPAGAPGDDIDRIVSAVGVDAMHSVDEEARMRAMTDEVLSNAPALTHLRAGPDFERVFRHLILDEQRMRRDPSVYRAYRSTLGRLLTPAELRTAASFYTSPAGLKAHIAVIEAEKASAAAIEAVPSRRPDNAAVSQAFRDTLERMLSSDERKVGAAFYETPEGQKIHAAVLEAEVAAGNAMDKVVASTEKGPPPGFTHNFDYGIDVFFARDSFEVDAPQRERIVSILKKPREADPKTEWCALLVGFSETGERDPALAQQRRDAVKVVLEELGVPDSNVSTQMLRAPSAYLKVGDPDAAITEIEQFPCGRR